MVLEIPDHYVANIGGALVERAVQVIEATAIVPAYLHQFADLWEKGVRYGGHPYSYAYNFWETVAQAGGDKAIMKGAGVL